MPRVLRGVRRDAANLPRNPAAVCPPLDEKSEFANAVPSEMTGPGQVRDLPGPFVIGVSIPDARRDGLRRMGTPSCPARLSAVGHWRRKSDRLIGAPDSNRPSC